MIFRAEDGRVRAIVLFSFLYLISFWTEGPRPRRVAIWGPLPLLNFCFQAHTRDERWTGNDLDEGVSARPRFRPTVPKGRLPSSLPRSLPREVGSGLGLRALRVVTASVDGHKLEECFVV